MPDDSERGSRATGWARAWHSGAVQAAREERLSRQVTPCSRSEPGRVWEIRRSRARLGGSAVDEDRPVMVLSQRGAADT